MLFLFSRETNLKVRQPLIETAELGDDLKALSNFQGMLLFSRSNYAFLSFHSRQIDCSVSGKHLWRLQKPLIVIEIFNTMLWIVLEKIIYSYFNTFLFVTLFLMFFTIDWIDYWFDYRF